MATDFYKQGGSYFTTSGQKVANLTELQKLAKAGGKEIAMPSVPTGATKIASPDQLKGLTEKDIFRQGQDIYRLPSINTTLDAEQVSPDVPEPEAVDDVSSYTAGIDTTIKGLEENIKKINEPLPQEQEISEIRKRQGELSEQKAQVQETALPKAEEFGYTQYTKELQALMPQIAKVKAEYDRLAEENLNRPISSRIVGGTADRIARQKAIELSGLSAIAQAYQGNIQLATQTAQNMVEMELAPIQTRIDDQKWQIEQVYEQLTSAEQKKADSLNLVLAERERLLEEEKERKMNIANLGIQAAQNGADQATIEKIMNATDYMKAIKLASEYLDESQGTWVESDITDANGNPLLFNSTTGEYKNSVGTSTSDIFFTDANGDSWNIAGWATDQTKPAQMDYWAKQIGKVTEENIDEKVKEFTPGLTADMIKEASAQSGVSWEAIMTMVVQEAQGGLSNVAKKNNNFGGLTFNNQEWIKPFGGEKGTERPEGGNYIKFPTKQQGLNAMAALMAQYGKVVPSSPESQFSRTAIDWAESIRDGKAELSDITSEVEKSNPGLKSEVIAVLKTLPPSKAQVNEAQDFVDKLVELRDAPGLSSAVGPTSIARGFFGLKGAMSGERDAFLGKADSLISKKALNSLIEAKSQGATFGALSDREMAILKAAGTSLGAWSNQSKDGKLKNFDVDEKTFKEELDNLIADYQDLLNSANITQSLDSYLKNNPEKVDEYNTILSNNPNLTDEEILQVIQ